jgi:methionine-rich copper-binding protein CopC
MSRWSTIPSLFWLLCARATLLAPDPASAHAYVDMSTPADRSTLPQAPTEVRLRFTETVELAFSRITVKSSSGKTVTRGALRQPAPNTLAIDLEPLEPGTYRIEWRVLSVDTHITDGVLRFAIAPRRTGTGP